jgi:ABC-2 type transport system permease protein/lipopolysaccharide transport system permease protein
MAEAPELEPIGPEGTHAAPDFENRRACAADAATIGSEHKGFKMTLSLDANADGKGHEAVSDSKGKSNSALALRDLSEGISLWRLWLMLGWNDILQRYRRSSLGPFWLTASMAIMVVALGLLYSELFRTSIQEFLPYLCLGLLVWTMIAGFLTESGTLFTGSESYIKQIRLPYTVYVFRATWSKLIIFGHNFIIYFAILFYFEIWPGAAALLAIPGMLIVTINCALASMLIGMLSARFRDIPQLVASLTQIIFFITPIMWKADLLQNRSYIATFNPFFQLIEIVRAPLLGSVPPLKTYIAVLIITILNLVVVSAFFTRFRSRISYWV